MPSTVRRSLSSCVETSALYGARVVAHSHLALGNTPEWEFGSLGIATTMRRSVLEPIRR